MLQYFSGLRRYQGAKWTSLANWRGCGDYRDIEFGQRIFKLELRAVEFEGVFAYYDARLNDGGGGGQSTQETGQGKREKPGLGWPDSPEGYEREDFSEGCPDGNDIGLRARDLAGRRGRYGGEPGSRDQRVQEGIGDERLDAVRCRAVVFRDGMWDQIIETMSKTGEDKLEGAKLEGIAGGMKHSKMMGPSNRRRKDSEQRERPAVRRRAGSALCPSCSGDSRSGKERLAWCRVSARDKKGLRDGPQAEVRKWNYARGGDDIRERITPKGSEEASADKREGRAPAQHEGRRTQISSGTGIAIDIDIGSRTAKQEPPAV
ncbi:hypothetical protein DFH09DRAFT_1079566 [Mycena vulgaris]|nr:hypothetical protein DFH09DRAFT_1079566 [Mycena vulgaris]